MTKIEEIIIIGGGPSIMPQIEVLKPFLASKLVITINYAYKHFPSTFLAFMDRDFYVPSFAKKELDKYPDIYEELKNLSLIIGLKLKNGMGEFLLPNTILVDCPNKAFASNCPLTGLFALSIAEKLEPKNIFLLGFDFNRRDPKKIPTGKNYNPVGTESLHYYSKKEINHKGINYYGFYENHNPNNYFKHFNNCKSKIYNVSPNSLIENFKKINYEQMFNLLSNQVVNQVEIRNNIKHSLI